MELPFGNLKYELSNFDKWIESDGFLSMYSDNYIQILHFRANRLRVAYLSQHYSFTSCQIQLHLQI